jgi:hypothetical protein
MGEDPKKAFIRLFHETARYHHRARVFEDLITCASISIENAWLKDDDLEKEYLEVIGRYEREDVERFPKLFGLITQGIDLKCDFLGGLFMELDLGSDQIGQFFSPYSVARLMAEMTMYDVERHFETHEILTLDEPAAGAGGMVIAIADVLKEKGINPQQKLWVRCTDVSPVAARLCYLQISLLGLPGLVVMGNTLTLETRRMMFTPMHHWGMWNAKLQRREMGNTATEPQASLQQQTIVRPPATKPVPAMPGQLSIFDVVAPERAGTG